MEYLAQCNGVSLTGCCILNLAYQNNPTYLMDAPYFAEGKEKIGE
jgi:hypothetical protein